MNFHQTTQSNIPKTFIVIFYKIKFSKDLKIYRFKGEAKNFLSTTSQKESQDQTNSRGIPLG